MSSDHSVAVKLVGVEQLRIVKVGLPQPCGPWDAIVTPKWTGICGSDMHLYTTAKVGLGRTPITKQFVLGHESAGVVVQGFGHRVTGLKVGDRVAMEPGEACMRCAYCKAGHYPQCEHMKFAAAAQVDGTLQGYFTLAADLCYKLPDSMSLEDGALIEPLAVAVNAVAKVARLPHSSNVVIFGAGPVGLFGTLAAAKALGAKRLILVDVNEDRLTFANRYIPDVEALLAEPLLKGESREAYSFRHASIISDRCGLSDRGDTGADVVLDCSGAEVCVQTGIWLTKRKGTFVQVGNPSKYTNVPLLAVAMREVTIKGCFRYGPGVYAMAIDLVARGLIDLRPLVTHRFSFSDVETAFKTVRSGTGPDGKMAIKVMISGPDLELGSASSTVDAVFKVVPGYQTYKWGKRGGSSLVAQLCKQNRPGFIVDTEQNYAELWMGTHPSKPGVLLDGTSLKSHLQTHPHLVGSISTKFPDEDPGSLPFLFKVLSPGTALGIQAHPDKELGQLLHARSPETYNDPNHKPEMAIALTRFQGMLGFRPIEEIIHFFRTVPELGFIPAEIIDLLEREPSKVNLRALFSAFITTPDRVVGPAVQAIAKRYADSGFQATPLERDITDLFIMLNEQYPLDIGVLCVFIFNIVSLEPGQAAFLGANEPHAYLCGDIIECMANSNNVIRAGLTYMQKDIPTLIDMLTYESGPGSRMCIEPVAFDESTRSTLYDPPIDEFAVIRVDVSRDGKESHRALRGPSMCVVTRGQGMVAWDTEQMDLSKGDVFFIAADTPVGWTGDMEVFRAFVET